VRIHHRIGELALQEAEFSRAYRHLSRALQITRSFLGDGTLIAEEIHINLGGLALEQLDFESAKSHLAKAYRAYRQSHRSWWAFAASSRLAASLAGLGQFQRANQIFDEARDWKKQVELPGIKAVYRTFRLVLKIANVQYGHTSESELASIGDELNELSEVHQGNLHVEEAIRPVKSYLQEVRRNDSSAAQMTSKLLLVQTQCRKFRPPGGEVQDISALTAPRRLLKKLVDERLEAPGRSVSVFELADAGWPNEELPPDTAKNRLYVAIRRLRSSGLGDLIKNETGGYYLSRNVSIRKVDKL
jgi:tetratricopeptide (TPR) repeat protein